MIKKKYYFIILDRIFGPLKNKRKTFLAIAKKK